MLGEFQGFEGREELDSPRCVFGCVEALACIVLSKSLLEIGRMATIDLLWLRNALENVGVEHGISFRLAQVRVAGKLERVWPFSLKTRAGLPSVARNRVSGDERRMVEAAGVEPSSTPAAQAANSFKMLINQTLMQIAIFGHS